MHTKNRNSIFHSHRYTDCTDDTHSKHIFHICAEKAVKFYSND